MAIVKFRIRRDTAANWTSENPTLALGEPGLETDTRKVKYGDGVTVWTLLAYAATGAQLTSANTWTAQQTFGDGSTDSSLKLFVKGITKGVRIGADTTGGRIEGVDTTGFGSFQPLLLNGSSLSFSINNTGAASLSSSGLNVIAAVVAGTFIKTTGKTVAALTAAATAGAGARDFVTDSTVAAAGNFGAAVSGGGANKVPVYSDGAAWLIG